MSELRFTFTVGVALYLLLNYWSGKSGVEAVSFDEDVTITKSQKLAIDKLRNRVLPYITEDYMKEDIYLVRWLRSTEFDVQWAEKKFIENIKWRKENRMATIDQEDFSDISLDYPYINDGYDKEGRPVLFAFAGEWNIRRAVLTGKVGRVLRYLDQGLEMLSRQIRVLQKEGKNVTQANLVVDLNEFSLVTHACVPCLMRIVEFLNSYEAHYPNMANLVFFVNAPPSVQFVIELIKQNVSRVSRDAIHVYGINRRQWEPVLLKYFDKKYLPIELGGTYERN